ALVVCEESRAPLGLGGVIAYTRDAGGYNRDRLTEAERAARPPEATRGRELVDEEQQRMRDLLPMHGMDRDADEFALFHDWACSGVRFVARMHLARRRRAKQGPGVALPIETVMEHAPVVATRKVPLSPRSGKRGLRAERIHPIREARLA